MKDGVSKIVGKRIRGVVEVHNKRRKPDHQLFLLFADGTHFELYCLDSEILCAGGAMPGDIDFFTEGRLSDSIERKHYDGSITD